MLRRCSVPAGRFLASLVNALETADNEYWWCLENLDLDLVRKAEPAFDAGQLQACGFTNWEMLMFRDRPDLWPRTRWWNHTGECLNPLPNF